MVFFTLPTPGEKLRIIGEPLDQALVALTFVPMDETKYYEARMLSGAPRKKSPEFIFLRSPVTHLRHQTSKMGISRAS